MSGAYWILAWMIFLGVALSGSAVLSSKPRGIHIWLSACGMLGGLGLLAMSAFLSRQHAGLIALPAPWPTMVTAPLPLARLWSIVAGLLFLAATLSTFSRRDGHRILYALLPLVSGVGVFLWSGDGLLLLASWEFVSAVTYLGLVTTRRARPVWNAGWALLALSELGGMLLLAALVWLVPAHAGSLQDTLTVHQTLGAAPPLGNVIMLLAVIAFGVKAGLFPVMIWMPMAEPESPGMVAGIFSGLLTALAFSGILAVLGMVGADLAWAVVLVVLGVLGALSGALYSIVSRHAKRVLAYSTLEIMGLVFTALGIWRIISVVAPHNVASTMALDAAVVLLVMHAGAKFVLFAATDFTGRWGQTMDRLGGLGHGSRGVAGLTLFATAALGAFPPLGGFVGEWLLLEGILKPVNAGSHAAHLGLMVLGAFLALTVAIGVAAYLRWYAFIFLGVHRGPKPIDGDQPRRSYLLALAIPLALVVVAGPGVPWFLPWLNHVLASYLTARSPVVAPTFIDPASAAPLVAIGANLVPAPGAHGTVFFPQEFNVGNPYVLLWMALAITVVVAGLRGLFRRKTGVRLVNPWNGGAEPFTTHTSWSAEGFVHPLRLAFARFYGLSRTRTHSEGAHFYRHTIINRLEEQVYGPLVGVGRWLAGHIRRMQSGRLNQYVTYVWIFVLIGMAVGVWR